MKPTYVHSLADLPPARLEELVRRGFLHDCHGGFHGISRVVSLDEPSPTIRPADGGQASQLRLHPPARKERRWPAP